MPRVIFGDYLPDQPAHLNQGVVTADGVYPIANGYAPVGSFAPLRNGTLAARCIGAGGYRYTGSPYLFAATTTNIYSYTASGYTSVASGLSSTTAVGVRFCPYAAFMLATNGVDPIKKFDPASPTAMTTLSTDAPKARYIAEAHDCVVAAYADDNPLQWAWSDTSAPGTWTTGGSSISGRATLKSGGDLTGVVGNSGYALLFQERAVSRADWTGDDKVWALSPLGRDIGCAAPKSLASYGNLSFFWSDKGFMACDGTTLQAIGSEKVDRTFQALADRAYFENMSAVVDPRNSLYIVSAPAAAPTSQVFIYNYALQKWSTATITGEFLFSALALATTLEDLDSIYGSIDAMTVSLDSPAFRGGYPLALMFDAAHRLGSMSGANLPATIIDAKREPISGRKSRIRSVRPLTDASAATVTLLTQDSLSETLASADYTARSSGGVYRTRGGGNFAQVKVSIPAGVTWNYLQGFDMEAIAGGRV